MKLRDLLDYVKVNNIDLDTDLGYIDGDGYYGMARQITILTNGNDDKLLCLDTNIDDY